MDYYYAEDFPCSLSPHLELRTSVKTSKFLQQVTLTASVVSFLSLASLIYAKPSQAAILNGSFQTGDFTGWQTLGSATVISNPGINEALITAGNDPEADVASFLGLASGSLNTLSRESTGDGVIIEQTCGESAGLISGGSVIKQTFTGEAGDVLTFDWNFIGKDYRPCFNDFAFASIISPVVLSNIAVVGNFGRSGVQTFSFTIPTTGTYTLGLGVMNVGDIFYSPQFSSQLVVNQVQLLSSTPIIESILPVEPTPPVNPTPAVNPTLPVNPTPPVEPTPPVNPTPPVSVKPPVEPASVPEPTSIVGLLVVTAMGVGSMLKRKQVKNI